MVLLSIGVRPDTKLSVQAGLKTGTARGIWVNEYLQTSNPDIYA
jgi:NAD(P)H-nitrite reductase large subunit